MPMDTIVGFVPEVAVKNHATNSYVLRLSLYLLSVLMFRCASVLNTLVYEFPISYSHTERYLLFSYSATTSARYVFGAKK